MYLSWGCNDIFSDLAYSPARLLSPSIRGVDGNEAIADLKSPS